MSLKALANKSGLISWSGLFSVIFLVFALAVRFYLLTEKPVHHDETINGWFVTQMWQTGFYRYDPNNYHGPLLFYLFQYAEPFFGDGIGTMRGLTAVFSVLSAMIFFVRGVRFSDWGSVAASFALVCSPAMEFFSRSAIHESSFAFFMLIFLLGLNQSWSLLLVGLVGMVVVKETWVLVVLSVFFAGLCCWTWLRPQFELLIKTISENKIYRAKLSRKIFLGILLIGLIFSGFGQHWSGVLDLFRAFLPWTKTGVGGAGHDKPFYLWLQLIAKFELPTLICLILSLGGIFLQSMKIRFFSILALTHFLLYSLIPYKTPWCLISIQMPLFFSAALVFSALVKAKGWRLKTAWVTLGTLSLFVNWETFYALNWQRPVDLNHPYVYVQTQYDVKNLISSIEKNGAALVNEKIQIANEENWPFPWLLRKFPKLVYGNPKSEPDLQAAVIIFDVDQAERLRPLLSSSYSESIMQVRQARQAAILFVRNDWAAKIGLAEELGR